jgi:hypothetical protein
MGVVDLQSTNLTLSSIRDHSALSKYSEGSGNLNLESIRANGAVNVHAQSNISMRGTAAHNGFERANATSQYKYRFVVIYGQNCQVQVAYPSIAGDGALYRPGTNSLYNRGYITAAESASGARLHVRGVNYNDYSYMTINANNFSYGYTTGQWVFYTSSGSYYSLGNSGNATQTLYPGNFTSSSAYYLAHIATTA